MAKIVLSDAAPKEPISFSLISTVVDLDGSKKNSSFTTDDRAVLEAATVHPWLAVVYDAAAEVPDYSERRATSVRPEDDALSASGPNAAVAFDPKAVAEVEEAKLAAYVQPVAIEAGLTQTDKVTTGGVAETLAAANSDAGKDK